MPFKSKSQLRTCYSTGAWNCDKWLSETQNICDLPERSSSDKISYRTIRKGEIIKGPIKKGPRGGKYFEIVEYQKGKVRCVIKVYTKRKCGRC